MGVASWFHRLWRRPQAAIRETLEETGLAITVSRLVDVIFDGTTIVIIYAAQVVGGVLNAMDDVVEARWFSPDTLPASSELAFKSTQALRICVVKSFSFLTVLCVQQATPPQQEGQCLNKRRNLLPKGSNYPVYCPSMCCWSFYQLL